MDPEIKATVKTKGYKYPPASYFIEETSIKLQKLLLEGLLLQLKCSHFGCATSSMLCKQLKIQVRF